MRGWDEGCRGSGVVCCLLRLIMRALLLLMLLELLELLELLRTRLLLLLLTLVRQHAAFGLWGSGVGIEG